MTPTYARVYHAEIFSSLAHSEGSFHADDVGIQGKHVHRTLGCHNNQLFGCGPAETRYSTALPSEKRV